MMRDRTFLKKFSWDDYDYTELPELCDNAVAPWRWNKAQCKDEPLSVEWLGERYGDIRFHWYVSKGDVGAPRHRCRTQHQSITSSSVKYSSGRSKLSADWQRASAPHLSVSFNSIGQNYGHLARRLSWITFFVTDVWFKQPTFICPAQQLI